MSLVQSINIGTSRDQPYAAFPTGIDKRPVESITVRAPGPRGLDGGSGVEGDHVGDRRHHGGDAQAVYAFAREELDWWQEQLGRTLASGIFGENLTTGGLDVDASLIGDVWQVGPQVQLRVEGPRIPCRTFAGHLGEQGWVKRFADHGRSGAYLSVQRPGVITTGDEVQVIARPEHDVDVPTVMRAFLTDMEAARRVVDAEVLNPMHHAELAAKVAKRS